MNNNKNIVLFVNDSYFSYLLAKKLIESYHDQIALIVFSKSTSSSFQKILNIYKKVSKNYFFYRVFVQILSNTLYKEKSIEFLANKNNIEKLYILNSENSELMKKIDNMSVGFAFNYDLIIKNKILMKFEKGIYNIHASKLPKDKGISPVLWAFARGDKSIWSTIYKMDEGIDSGPIATQLQIPIKEDDTAFSLYKRVCLKSGEALNNLVDKILDNSLLLSKQSEEIMTNYFSWPDKEFCSMMKTSGRNLIRINNIKKDKYKYKDSDNADTIS